MFHPVPALEAEAVSDVSRAQLKKYREVISLWLSKFDTNEIALQTNLPEHLVAKRVANFRDMTIGAAA